MDHILESIALDVIKFVRTSFRAGTPYRINTDTIIIIGDEAHEAVIQLDAESMDFILNDLRET